MTDELEPMSQRSRALLDGAKEIPHADAATRDRVWRRVQSSMAVMAELEATQSVTPSTKSPPATPTATASAESGTLSWVAIAVVSAALGAVGGYFVGLESGRSGSDARDPRTTSSNAAPSSAPVDSSAPPSGPVAPLGGPAVEARSLEDAAALRRAPEERRDSNTRSEGERTQRDRELRNRAGVDADSRADSSAESTPSTPAPPTRDEELALENEIIARAQTALARGRPADVLAAANEHQRRFPHGRFVQERESMVIQAMVRLGDTEAAQLRAERFLARYPNSLQAPIVRRVTGAR